jgi:hypothetical protein
MRRFEMLLCALLFLLILLGPISAAQAIDIDVFLGRWALYVPNGGSWLHIYKQGDGPGKFHLEAELLWYGGSVTPLVPRADIEDEDTLVVYRTSTVVTERDANGKVLKSHTAINRLEFKLNGLDRMTGKYIESGRNGIGARITEIKAKRIPPLPPAPDLSKVTYGDPVTLFAEKSDWKPTRARARTAFDFDDNGFLVNNPVQPENGARVHYGNIQSIQEFEDFRLTLEVNVPAHSNSGVYLKGIYEVQVSDSYGRSLDSHNMGALYSRITPTVAAEKPAGQWQTMDITLCDRHATVILNGIKIIDNQPLLGVTGGNLTPDEFSPGPIYLQGDHGKVMYRNIVLHPIIK